MTDYTDKASQTKADAPDTTKKESNSPRPQAIDQ